MKRPMDPHEHMLDMAVFWNNSVNVFQKRNPDVNDRRIQIVPIENLDDPKVQALMQGPVMFIYTACAMRPENADKSLEDNLQADLYKMSNLWAQQNRASGVKCDMLPPYDIALKIKGRKGFVSACVNKGHRQSSHYLNDAGSVVFCTKGNSDEKCYELELNATNVCLSTYGDCKPDQNNICGWHQTDASRSCIENW